MAIMTPEQADALLSRGVISPEQHAAIVGPVASPMGAAPAYGPATIPWRAAEPSLGSPPVSYITPHDPDVESMDGGSVNLPATVPTSYRMDQVSAPQALFNRVAGALPPSAAQVQREAELRDFVGPPAPPPVQAAPAAPPEPRGDVSVGPVTPGPVTPGAPQAPPASAMTAGGPAPRPAPDPRQTAVRHGQEALDARRASQGQLNDLDAQRGVEAQDAARDRRDAEEQQYVLQQAARQQERAKIDAAVAERRQAIQEYTDAKVDPDKFWKDQSGGQRALSVLSLMLGGFAEGLSGGRVRNAAMEMIQRDIDRSIRTQEIEVEKKGKAVDVAGSSIAQLRALSGDNEAARTAERIRQLGIYQDRVSTLTAKYDSERARVNGQQLLADIDAERTKLQDDLDVRLRQEAQARAASAASAAHQARKEDRQYGLDVAKVRIDAQRAANEAQSRQTGPNSPAQKSAALAADKSVIDRVFGQAEKNLPTLGTGFLPSVSDSARDYDAAVAAGVGALRGTGDADKASEERLKSMLPLPGDSPAVIARKKSLAYAKLLSNHASPENNAAERERDPDAAVGARPVKSP